MVDGTCRPWLHHKEVVSVIVRLVVNAEVSVHFLALPTLVDMHGHRANVAGYLHIIRSIFVDYPELEQICVGVATNATNVMSTAE